MWEKNQKIIDIIDKKTFQPGLKAKKEKPRLCEKEGVCLMRDLDDERLGQNKVLCSSSEVKLPLIKLPLQALQHFPRQGDGFPAICRFLALEPHQLGFLLVAFSLSFHLVCFLARLASRLRFCFRGLMGLTISLAINGAMSIAGEVAVSLSR